MDKGASPLTKYLFHFGLGKRITMKQILFILFWSIVFMMPLEAFACHKGGPMGFANNDLGNFIVDLTSSPSYALGSTSGTSGCKDWDIAHHLTQAKTNYLIAEWDYFTEEAARGQGEHVQALAQLMGCSRREQEPFASLLKTNYIPLFDQALEKTKENSQKFLTNLEMLMAQENFSGICRDSDQLSF